MVKDSAGKPVLFCRVMVSVVAGVLDPADEIASEERIKKAFNVLIDVDRK